MPGQDWSEGKQWNKQIKQQEDIHLVPDYNIFHMRKYAEDSYEK